MPGPLARPLETVSPDVSECSRMPCRRRPVKNAATPWAPSWVMVTSIRVYGQIARGRTRAAGQHGCQGDHDRGRRRLYSSRPTPNLRDQLHASSMNDERAGATQSASIQSR